MAPPGAKTAARPRSGNCKSLPPDRAEGPQRRVEAKGHVPGLACEYREDRCGFGSRHTAGKERHEKDDRERNVSQYRHGLEDVEQWDEDEFSAPAFGGERPIA